jgi:nucleotide-binding universal stress UspA family protein
MNPPIEKILVPIDFSDQYEAVLRIAESMARSENAKLILAHVVEPVQPIAETAPYTHVEVAMADADREKLQTITPTDPSIPFEHCLKEGSPSKGIVEIAKEEQVDLIVMGTHGRRGLSRVLMGSVAEDVVRRAPCPVLTLKPSQEVLEAAEKAKAEEKCDSCDESSETKPAEDEHESLQDYVG